MNRSQTHLGGTFRIENEEIVLNVKYGKPYQCVPGVY